MNGHSSVDRGVEKAVIVLRAHNEDSNIVRILDQVAPYQLPVIVAASGCTDDTVPLAVAHRAVCDVLVTPRGLGATTVGILSHLMNRTVVIIDADITHLPLTVVPDLVSAASSGRLGRGKFLTPGPSEMLIPGLAAATGVTLPPIDPQCLATGLQSFPRGFAATIDLSRVPKDRGSDLAIGLLADEAGWRFEEVPAGPRTDEQGFRGPEHVNRLISANLATFHAAAVRRFAPQAA